LGTFQLIDFLGTICITVVSLPYLAYLQGSSKTN